MGRVEVIVARPISRAAQPKERLFDIPKDSLVVRVAHVNAGIAQIGFEPVVDVTPLLTLHRAFRGIAEIRQIQIEVLG
jgi:hypothetical protein